MRQRQRRPDRRQAGSAAVGCGCVIAIGVALLSSSLSFSVRAQKRLGAELQVNTYTTSSQRFPSVATGADGSFVVVWQSYGQDGGGYGVFGRRLASGGGSPGAELQVNTSTAYSQYRPAVVMDAAGNFVVVWSGFVEGGGGYDVFRRRLASDGNPLGDEARVNAHTTSFQSRPAVAMDAAGNFVVVWSSYEQDGSNYGVFGRRFTSDGAPMGGEFQVNTYTTYPQRFPSVAMGAGGDFVVVWQSYLQDGSGYGVFGRSFPGGFGSPGPEFQVNTYTTYSQFRPSVATDPDGNFVIAWSGYGQEGGSYDIFARRFASGGAPLGDALRVNTNTTSFQGLPSVAMHAAGHFVIVWSSFGQDGSNYGIFGRRFLSDGAPLGGEFQVNTYTTAPQRHPSVAMDAAGDFVVVWHSFYQDGGNYGVFAQRFRFGDLDFFIGDDEGGNVERTTPPAPIETAGKPR